MKISLAFAFLFFGSFMMSLGIQAQPPPPRTIAKGEQSSIDTPLQQLVQIEEEWAALWRRHAGDQPRPPVDFRREMVAAVFMGTRNHGGFNTAIVSSMEVKGVLIVRYTETVPPRNAITAQVLTSPYHIVAIPKAAVTAVKFEKAP